MSGVLWHSLIMLAYPFGFQGNFLRHMAPLFHFKYFSHGGKYFLCAGMALLQSDEINLAMRGTLK